MHWHVRMRSYKGRVCGNNRVLIVTGFTSNVQGIARTDPSRWGGGGGGCRSGFHVILPLLDAHARTHTHTHTHTYNGDNSHNNYVWSLNHSVVKLLLSQIADSRYETPQTWTFHGDYSPRVKEYLIPLSPLATLSTVHAFDPTLQGIETNLSGKRSITRTFHQ